MRKVIIAAGLATAFITPSVASAAPAPVAPSYEAVTGTCGTGDTGIGQLQQGVIEPSGWWRAGRVCLRLGNGWPVWSSDRVWGS